MQKNIPCTPMDPPQIGGVYAQKFRKKKKKLRMLGVFKHPRVVNPPTPKNLGNRVFFFPRKMEATTNDHKITTFFKIKNVHDICFC